MFQGYSVPRLVAKQDPLSIVHLAWGTRRLLHFLFQVDCQAQFLDYPKFCMRDSEGSALSVYEVTIKPLEHAASHA